MNPVLRFCVALLPLALAPVLVYLIAYGILDLGGGEKDLVWVIPWSLWSLVFALASMVLWRKGWSLWRASAHAALIGLGGVVFAAVVLAAIGQLGIGGRF